MKKDAGLWFEVKSPIKQMNAQTLDQFLSEIEALTKDYPEYCEGVRILDGLECYFTYKIDGNIVRLCFGPRDQMKAMLNSMGWSTHEPWSPLPERTDKT